MLLPAFDGTKTGVPAYSVNVETCVFQVVVGGYFSFIYIYAFLNRDFFLKIVAKVLRMEIKTLFFLQKRLLVNLNLNTWRN